MLCYLFSSKHLKYIRTIPQKIIMYFELNFEIAKSSGMSIEEKPQVTKYRQDISSKYTSEKSLLKTKFEKFQSTLSTTNSELVHLKNVTNDKELEIQKLLHEKIELQNQVRESQNHIEKLQAKFLKVEKMSNR